MNRFPVVALGLLALGVISCDGNTATPPTDYTTLLQYLGESVIIPEHAAFATSADALDAAMAEVESNPSEATVTAAQEAWRDARRSFRTLDALHFGPIADKGISERIDLGPTSDSGIEAIIAGADPLDESTISKAGGKSKGFLGLQYLLFSSNGPSDVVTALSGDAGLRRRTLARLMADEIATSAHQLDDAWRADSGNFIAEFEQAGKTSKQYTSQRAAIDDIVGAVGYGWEEVVGVRLAEPLGLKSGGAADPTLDPTSRSDNANADNLATMAGIEALYKGEGFSARVHTKNVAEDSQMISQLAKCVGGINAIPTPFASALTNDYSVVNAAYTACKAGKGTWNTDITSALGATLRPSDTDGD